ncbi:class I glutamine amidotransferase-like protein [Xylaria bambusicola]|uniref:class I glutamine amidotransferase-like protein n=1 Tax=Xylaria bambusicola TaxID=326684 RepID=UPI002008CB73|nr:class I glutamine amidotransferase-like protein [Xylaria bambusicola]KAI0528014.1 class I glutamine amidotransferase-like protein [Xylaria bambusicola]
MDSHRYRFSTTAGSVQTRPPYLLPNPSVTSPKPEDGRNMNLSTHCRDPASTDDVKPALTTAPPRIAVLLNSYRSRLLPAIRSSYQRTIRAVAPNAQLAFYEPANRPGEFPNPDYFDLIVLGGSNVDPRKRHPWILEVHAFVRRMVRDYPHKKFVGICWGHQTISHVFGGKLVDAAVPEMGVASVELTEQGRAFFHEASSLGSFKLQQHHRREVAAAPLGFVPLAHSNQCFMSESNAILTFQGHPEKDAETARLRLHDSMRWFGFDALSDEKAWAQLEMLINTPHDGEMVWRRIFEWVREPCSETGVAQQTAALALAEKTSKM